jgi:hypothetical protein
MTYDSIKVQLKLSLCLNLFVLECSLAAWKAEQFAAEVKMYSQPIHCLEDGSYDPLQCSTDRCRCLQAGSNVPDADHGILEINIMEDNPECCKHVYFS